ncbi:hypothetical protein ABID19_006513 [Mesorhizobium robiniae]|uniref:Uncharacterized protein n=1 Tax=Mesorhizobium robiniae TaxID=559315 RepID=A0ABV2GYS8_9HYPH
MASVIEPYLGVDRLRRGMEFRSKAALDQSFAYVELVGYPADSQRNLKVVLHQQHCAFQDFVPDDNLKAPGRLRRLTLCRLVEHHNPQTLGGQGFAEVPVDEEGCKMRGARAARTGQPVSIDNENLVGNGLKALEKSQEIRIVEPADATPITVHQTGTVQDERTGTQPHERHASLGSDPQMVVKPGVDKEAFLFENPANDHQVVKAAKISDPFMGRNRNAAAGQDRRHIGRYDTPLAVDWAASVPIVGSKSQHVYEICERPKCKAVEEEKPDG